MFNGDSDGDNSCYDSDEYDETEPAYTKVERRELLRMRAIREFGSGTALTPKRFFGSLSYKHWEMPPLKLSHYRVQHERHSYKLEHLNKS